MFHQNIFIICVLIPMFIYFCKKTMKIVSFSMQIIRNLKSVGAISKIVQIGSNLFVTNFLMYSYILFFL